MTSSSGQRFRALHDTFFVLPNPWDRGSAVQLEQLGFVAIATTSSGFAQSLGRRDGEVTRDELVEHVAQLASVVDIPINVDAERCFASDPAGVAETVRLLAEAGAAGVSIEDWDPSTNTIDDPTQATERVAAAAEAGRTHDVVITARCEHHIRGVDDFDATLARLTAYRDAGADVLYAPGLTTEDHISAVVALGRPVNVLDFGDSPSAARLAQLGVSRMSIGGALAAIAYRAFRDAAKELLTQGPSA